MGFSPKPATLFRPREPRLCTRYLFFPERPLLTGPFGQQRFTSSFPNSIPLPQLEPQDPREERKIHKAPRHVLRACYERGSFNRPSSIRHVQHDSITVISQIMKPRPRSCSLKIRPNQNLNICLTPKLCSIHQILQPRPTDPYFRIKEAKIKEQGGKGPTVTQVTSGGLRLDPGPLAFLLQSSVCLSTFLLPHPLT